MIIKIALFRNFKDILIFKMKLFIVFCFCAYTVANHDIGFPAGLMKDCPGMRKSTTFSEETRNSLTVVAIRPGPISWFGSEEQTCKLSPEGASCVEEYLDLKNRKTLVFIGGYLDASFSPNLRVVIAPYLNNGRNVIIVELYPVLLKTYPVAARITKPLGFALGKFLAELTRKGLHPNNLELLGGSLGAHIASFAATKYFEITRRKPARLTGLDPAGPCFRSLPRSERFNSDSAHQVDAVHTNIDGFGLADPVAHVDFYVNGGEFQPSTVGNFLLPCFQLCSHVRSGVYWTLALEHKNKFLAVKCDSVAQVRHGNCYEGPLETNVLGPNTNFSRPGVYYLPTLDTSPYYMGDEGLKKRKFDVNVYLTKLSPDDNMVV